MTDILLLHGALGAAAQMQPLAAVLPQNCPIHIFQFEGHGGEPFSDGQLTINRFAQQVVQWIQLKQLQKVQIFGYSMGGYVGLYLARHFPHLVLSVATLATKFDWNPQTAAKEAAMLNIAKIKEKVPAFAARLQLLHGHNWEKLLQSTAEMLLALGQQPSLTAQDLLAIQCPVRLGVGDSDSMVSLEETIAAYRQLPNGQLLVLPHTQHPFEKVNMNLLANTLTGFFAHI